MDSKESHNYFKLVYIVLDFVSEVLRDVFRNEWNTLYPATTWNDHDMGVSLGRFQAMTVSHGRLSPASRNHYNNLGKTNGDCNTWDPTLLKYAILYSVPINLLNKGAAKALVCSSVEKLVKIRNEVAHNHKAASTNAEFIKTYNEIETELKNLGTIGRSYIQKIENVKNGRISEAEMIRLENDLAEVKKEHEQELKRQRIERSIHVIFIVIATIFLYLLYTFFVPPFVPSYFPHDEIPAGSNFVGRNDIVLKAVESVNGGCKITVLHGPDGIGKRAAGLWVGKTILNQWLPFPQTIVVYTSLNGVTNLFTLQQKLLEAFFLYPSSNISYQLKHFFTSILKRRTLIVVDDLINILESEMGHFARDLLLDLPKWNSGLQMVLLYRLPLQFVDFKVVNIPVIPLSEEDSRSVIHSISTGLNEIEIQHTIDTCGGHPLLLQLFRTLRNAGYHTSIPTEGFKNEGINPLEIIAICFYSLNVDDQIITLSLWFPNVVVLNSLRKTFPSKESYISDLSRIGRYVELPEPLSFQNKQWRSHELLHRFTNKLCKSAAETSQLGVHCKKLGHDFQYKYMSLVMDSADSLYKEQIFYNTQQLISTSDQIYVQQMLSNGKLYTDLYPVFFSTLEKASACFLFGIHEHVFSKYTMYEGATLFRKIHIGHFMTLLFLQTDRGDIYFFNHPNPYEKVTVLNLENLDILTDSKECNLIENAKIRGMCFLVQGRLVTLHSSHPSLSSKVKHNPDLGLKLISDAADIFDKGIMWHEKAEALSTKGLVLVSMEKYSQALTLYRQAHEILTMLYTNNIFLAASHFNIAYCSYRMAGFNLINAVFHFKESFSIYNHTLGLHRRTANAIFFHGSVLQALGKFDLSRESLETAYEIQNQVITLHTDISQAPKDQAELLYMKYMHDQTNNLLAQQLQILSLPQQASLMSSFWIYKLGNCMASTEDWTAAENSYKTATEMLHSLCQKDKRLYIFYNSLTDDIASMLENHKLKAFEERPNVLFSIMTGVLYAFIILCGTVLVVCLMAVRNMEFIITL